jgi:hypothetical protein
MNGGFWHKKSLLLEIDICMFLAVKFDLSPQLRIDKSEVGQEMGAAGMQLYWLKYIAFYLHTSSQQSCILAELTPNLLFRKALKRFSFSDAGIYVFLS